MLFNCTFFHAEKAHFLRATFDYNWLTQSLFYSHSLDSLTFCENGGEKMSGDGVDLNSSHLQSALRKREYKNLLEIGGQTAENADNNSVADNLIALRDLLTKTNELAGQGTILDRIGQSAEVVLDAQVYAIRIDSFNKITE